MATAGQIFYSVSSLGSFGSADVLAGRVVKLNPALITITDGLVGTRPIDELQGLVRDRVLELLSHKVRTFHIDINFEDYSGFPSRKPDLNGTVFTPAFLEDLSETVQSRGGYLNLHLLTDHPQQRLREFARVGAGAICFQLEVLPGPSEVEALVQRILDLGACASPVIETVGSDRLAPLPPERAVSLLGPSASGIGMLTLQAAGTASRSNQASGSWTRDNLQRYLDHMSGCFSGSVQLQGGVTTSTIGEAVRLGAEFLVVGTQLFRCSEGLSPTQVVDLLLAEAANALAPDGG